MHTSPQNRLSMRIVPSPLLCVTEHFVRVLRLRKQPRAFLDTVRILIWTVNIICQENKPS
jgi:hypothetical protein